MVLDGLCCNGGSKFLASVVTKSDANGEVAEYTAKIYMR